MSCCKNNGHKYDAVANDAPRNYDKNFKGPTSKRSCTDVICCVIFFIFILGLIFVAFWAYIFGDMNKLIYPTNSEGELCGYSANLKATPKLVFFNLFVCMNMGPALIGFGCPTKQICVSKCPQMFWSTQLNTGRANMICEGDKTGNDSPYNKMEIVELINRRKCAEYVFPSIAITNRCIPNFFELETFFKTNISGNYANQTREILNKIKQNDKYFDITEFLSKLFIDFIRWYKYVCILFAASLLLSLLYLLLLRYFAAVVVWGSLILLVLIFIAGSIICFFTYYVIEKQYDTSSYLSWYILSKYQNNKFWLGMGIAVTILLAILVLILVLFRKQIKLSIGIIISTSKTLEYMMGIFLCPVILFAVQIMILAGSIFLVIQLSTIRKVEGVSADVQNLTYLSAEDIQRKLRNMLEKIPCVPGDNSTSQKICTFLKYGSNGYIYIFSGYVLFMFFWLTNFVKAVGQITIAGSFASYYFAYRKPKDIPTFPVLLSFWRAIRYHLGSLAFGSLLLAILQLIRAILEYLSQKAKDSHNICAQFVAKCLKCCFWCLEKFMKFLNKNAYIMIAIYGQSYCSAAQNAFHLLARNCIRVLVVDKVTDFVLLISKLVIVGIFGVLSFLFFNGIILKDMTENIFYVYVPIIVVIIGTYIIASMILQIFELGVDTIFLCFCEDLERNDGSESHPYFMTQDLKSTLMKYNRKSMEIKNRKGDTVDGSERSSKLRNSENRESSGIFSKNRNSGNKESPVRFSKNRSSESRPSSKRSSKSRNSEKIDSANRLSKLSKDGSNRDSAVKESVFFD